VHKHKCLLEMWHPNTQQPSSTEQQAPSVLADRLQPPAPENTTVMECVHDLQTGHHIYTSTSLSAGGNAQKYFTSN
jgi:hypothetical protein